MTTKTPHEDALPNGAALAAFGAAAVGACAMGLVSLLDAIGVVAVPALYGPAGGVTGRTTLAVLIWLITWALLHRRWNQREMANGRILRAAVPATILGIVLALPPVWALFETDEPGADNVRQEDQMEAFQPGIPESLRLEHEEIHGRLVDATAAPGRVGEAARALADVLHPHFVREEEIALPPLGLLAPLAAGEFAPEMRDVLRMTDALRAELPRMLEEHEAIAAAAQRLEQAAREAGNAPVAELARALQLHARGEEELFYPAAVLVGEVVRARST